MIGYHRIRGIHRLVHGGSEVAGFEHDLEIGIEIGIEIGKRCEMIEVGRTAGVEKVEVGEKVLAVVPRNLS